MFGGQDDNAGAPQMSGPAGNDDTLNGVADLVGGTAVPGPGDVGYIPPAPADPPQTDLPAPTDEPQDAPAPADDPPADPAPAPAPSDDGADDGLLELKQQALQQLTPLVGQLEQTPEEKFRTTMMLIQAADNKDLLKDAYEAAQAIPDEKIKAQALLDVINEINYFTQKQGE